MMPTVLGRIGVSEDYQSFLIDTMNSQDIAFTTWCVYKDKNCSEGPIFANETYATNSNESYSEKFTDRSANGFTANGTFLGDSQRTINATNKTPYENWQSLNMIEEVSKDAWLYGWNSSYGSLTFAYTSSWLWFLRDKSGENAKMQWFIQTGAVCDQEDIFKDVDYTTSISQLYIGPGETTTLFDTSNPYLTISQNLDLDTYYEPAPYSLSKLEFGYCNNYD